LFRALVMFCLRATLFWTIHLIDTPRMNFPGTNLTYDTARAEWNVFNS